MKNLDQTVWDTIISSKQLAIDHQMVPYDIWGTMAHVVMLKKTKIIDGQKAAKILAALFAIEKEYQEGKYKIDSQKGAQLSLEAKIIKKAGEDAGLSVHTARSRNDQVVTAEMLYLREKLLVLALNILKVLKSLLVLAKREQITIMPGYTHMRPAKPTTFAYWCLAYFDGLLRGWQSIKQVYQRYNLSPLGSVASFGTRWPIDRALTAKLLGFNKVWEIPQDAISSRGFFQLEILAGLNLVSIVASKLAADLLLFSTDEFGMVTLGEDIAQRLHPLTGSSVMPQKKNPDALELIRATAPQVTGCYQIVAGILSGLQSGYNRDTREVKEYVEIGLTKTQMVFGVLEKVLSSLKLNKKRMVELVKKNYSLAPDLADFLSQQTGYPYRLVHKVVGEVVDYSIRKGKLLDELTIDEINKVAQAHGLCFMVSDSNLKQGLELKEIVEKRTHIGGSNSKLTQSLVVDRMEKVAEIREWLDSQHERMAKAKSETWTRAKFITRSFGR